MDFKQQDIYLLLDNTTLITQIRSLRTLLMNIRNREDKGIFIHNLTRLILANKKINPETWIDFRPLSIIPAFLIIMEKIYVSAFNGDIQNTTSQLQIAPNRV